VRVRGPNLALAALDGLPAMPYEVESGDYALGKSTLDALDKAEARHPDSVFYIMRVGYRTAGRIGAPLAGAKP